MEINHLEPDSFSAGGNWRAAWHPHSAGQHGQKGRSLDLEESHAVAVLGVPPYGIFHLQAAAEDGRSSRQNPL